MPNFRPTALACCLILAIAAPHADAARKRKPATPPKPTTPAACLDYYAFANADWIKANPAPAAGSISALGQLADKARQQQRELLEASMRNPQNDVQKLLGDFWASGLDEAAVERDGAAPIAPLLARIDAIKKPKDIAPAIAALHQVGLPVAFDFTADLDLNNLDTYLGYFEFGGTGLPEPAFYTRSDADARALLGEYNGYVRRILALAGTPQARVDADAQLVIDLETRIARAAKARSADPRARYSPVATKDFPKRYRNLQLDAFLRAQGVKADQVSMADAALFAQIDKLIGSLKPAQWQAYLRFHVGSAMAPYLGKPWREADFAFRGRLLRGETAPPQRWEQVLAAIDASAGAMLSREYTATFLSDMSRRRAEDIAKQVRDALSESVEANTWMDAAAKAEAKDKLQKLKLEIGKPRIDPDFSIQPMGRGSFGSNILIASTWHHREEMRRIGRGNADRRWDVRPQAPALSYDVAHNRLFVTAAVLQAPVLDMRQSEAAQYGSLGALIGHELTNAVIGRGRFVDAKGDVREWWTPATLQAWQARIAPLTAQYSGYAYPGQPTVKVDGARTLEKNAADLSGLEVAWAALRKADRNLDANAQKAFFDGWAQLWPQQFAAGAVPGHAAYAAHAPGLWRSNGTLSQLGEFHAAYGCKAGNPMFRAEAERVAIWK
jgi:putative endopeptidase